MIKGDLMVNENFYTFSEYMKNDKKLLSPSMEDYVEMMYRISILKGNVRVNDLSTALNVQPPSTTKMMNKLSKIGMCKYEKHGDIRLTQKGNEIGKYLLYRHNMVETFLIHIGVKESVFEQTEKIEHVINDETLKCIVSYMKNVK